MADFNLGRLKFNWKGEWAGTTAYVKDDVVRKDANSYICLLAHTSGTWSTDLAATKWELMIPGTTGSATTTDGDMVYNDSGTDVRLPIGTAGQALIVDDVGHPAWTNLATAQSIYYVKADGNDDNNGSNLNEAFRTIRHACDTVTGPATIYVKGGLYYELLPIKVPANVTIVGDGQRTTGVAPVNITNNSATITATSGAQASTTIVIDTSADVGGTWTIGDTVTIGTITSGSGISGTVTITDIEYNTPGALETRLTVSFTSQTVTLTNCTISSDYSEGTMWMLNDGATLNKMYFRGMEGWAPNLSFPEDVDQATTKAVFVALDPDGPIINKSPYVIECSAFSDTGAIGALVDGDLHATGNKSMVFHGFTIVASDGVGYWVKGQGKSEIVSCFTYYCWVGYTTTGGGKIRALNGNNSYGTYGVISRGFDSDETPVLGTLHGNQISYNELTLDGDFLTGQTIVGNISGATGIIRNVQAAVGKLYYLNTNASTFQAGEDIVSTGGITVSTTYSTLTGTSVTAAASYTAVTQKSSSGIGRGAVFTITKAGSGTSYNGATTVTMTTAGAGYEVGDTITIAGDDLGGSDTTNDFTFTLATSVSTTGASVTINTGGVTGQSGFVIVADGFSELPRPGGSVSLDGDTLSYVIQSVSGSYTNSSSILTIVFANEKPTASADNTAVTIRYNYSNSRLTGHDFLSIGTGDKTSTNYPGEPLQASSQANEVIESYPGRVFYVSTDQDGNFRVGDYFRVDQATGRATLNANAFDLSGLTSLRLGSIGAQLGELVSEFSSDSTLSGDSNEAVPTEAAVRGYFANIATDVVPVDDDVQTLGTALKRWNHLYVGDGSVTIGGVTLSEVGGALVVENASTGAPAPAAVSTISNGTSSVAVANNGAVTITTNNALALTIATDGAVTFAGNLTVNGTTTTINSTTLTVDDKNIELASVASPTDTTADGAGITVKGATDKTLNWVDSTDAWTSSEHLNLVTGKAYYINGTSVLDSTTLGSGVTGSSLTSVGTLSGGLNIAASQTYKVDTSEVLSKSKLTLNGSSSGTVALQAAAAAGSVTYTLPSADAGASGYALTSNGSGTLSWTNIAESTSVNKQVGSLGVGTAASGTTGEIRATNAITSYYSDDRLKTRLGKIENALDKICALEGFYYEANETAQALGYDVKREVGVSAQSTQRDMAEIVKPAPISDQYLTVQYEKFAPYIIEAIKELRAEIQALKDSK
jgi:hypothetical protein